MAARGRGEKVLPLKQLCISGRAHYACGKCANGDAADMAWRRAGLGDRLGGTGDNLQQSELGQTWQGLDLSSWRQRYVAGSTASARNP